MYILIGTYTFSICRVLWVFRFDITLCNVYDKDKPWWRISPGMPFLKNLPTEDAPANITHDEWLEQKADQVRDKIHVREEEEDQGRKIERGEAMSWLE